MKSVRTTLAYAAAWSILAFGTLALLNPLVAVRLVGLEIVEPRGWSDFRATYGAMWIVMGAALLWAIPTRPRSQGWVRLTAAMWTAAAVARVASVVLDGVWTPVNVAVTAAYVAIAAALVLASLQRIRPRTPSSDRAGADAAEGRRSLPWRRTGRAGTADDVGRTVRDLGARERTVRGGPVADRAGALRDAQGGGADGRDDDDHMDDDRAVPPPPLWSAGEAASPVDDATPAQDDEEVKSS